MADHFFEFFLQSHDLIQLDENFRKTIATREKKVKKPLETQKVKYIDKNIVTFSCRIGSREPIGHTTQFAKALLPTRNVLRQNPLRMLVNFLSLGKMHAIVFLGNLTYNTFPDIVS